MHIVTTLVWAALGQSALAVRPYPPLAASKRSDISKRSPQPAAQQDGLTCEETYGPGSMACGKPSLKLCFNPSKGESCCGMDGGFCEAGFECAPVSKFCCKTGEDIATCAKNAGFEVPAVESPPDDGTPSVSPIFNATTTATASSTILGSIAADSSTKRFNNSTVLSLSPIVAPATEDCATTVTVFTPQVPGQPTPLPTTAAPAPVPAPAPTTVQTSSPEPTSDDGGDDDDYWQFNTDQETNDVEPATGAAAPTVVAAATPNTNYTVPVTTPSGPVASVSPIVQVASAGSSGVQPPTLSVWSYIIGAAAMMLFMSL